MSNLDHIVPGALPAESSSSFLSCNTWSGNEGADSKVGASERTNSNLVKFFQWNRTSTLKNDHTERRSHAKNPLARNPNALERRTDSLHTVFDWSNPTSSHFARSIDECAEGEHYKTKELGYETSETVSSLSMFGVEEEFERRRAQTKREASLDAIRKRRAVADTRRERRGRNGLAAYLEGSHSRDGEKNGRESFAGRNSDESSPKSFIKSKYEMTRASRRISFSLDDGSASAVEAESTPELQELPLRLHPKVDSRLSACQALSKTSLEEHVEKAMPNSFELLRIYGLSSMSIPRPDGNIHVQEEEDSHVDLSQIYESNWDSDEEDEESYASSVDC